MTWETIKLSECIEVVMGQAPPGAECNIQGNGMVFVKAGEFGKKYPQIREWTTKPLRIAKPNDSLVCVVGATCGKVNQANIECAIGRSVAAIRSIPKKIDKNFLYLFLKTRINFLRDRSQGAAQGVITREMIQSLEISLPPLEEQQRISAILDKVEEIERKREMTIQKLDELAQSVFIEMFGNPVSNGHGYSIKTLKELGNVKTGGTPPSALDNMFGGDIPFITPGDLNSGVDVRRHLTPDGASQSVVVKKGSALVCCIGATIGKMAKANSECAFNQQINAIEWGDEVDDDYGIFALTLMKPIIISSATSTTLPILNKTSFEKIKFPVPPIEKQVIFSKTVKKLEQLKAMSLNSKNLVINSMSSLQSQAFSGQL